MLSERNRNLESIEVGDGDFDYRFWENLRRCRVDDSVTADLGPYEHVLIKLLNDLDHPLLIDIGCGDGTLARRLVGIPGLTYVGVDRSRGGIRITPGDVPERGIHFVLGDGGQLPVKSSCIDVAIMLGALHHGGWSMIAEARRVLRPKGVLAIIDHSVDDTLVSKLTYKLAELVPDGIRDHPPLDHFFLGGSVPDTLRYTKHELCSILSADGFEDRQWFYYTSGALFGFEALTLLVEGLLPATAKSMRGFRMKANRVDLKWTSHSHNERTVNFMLIARAPASVAQDRAQSTAPAARSADL